MILILYILIYSSLSYIFIAFTILKLSTIYFSHTLLLHSVKYVCYIQAWWLNRYPLSYVTLGKKFLTVMLALKTFALSIYNRLFHAGVVRTVSFQCTPDADRLASGGVYPSESGVSHPICRSNHLQDGRSRDADTAIFMPSLSQLVPIQRNNFT